MMDFIFSLFCCYLVGSIPFGIFFGIGMSGKDPRQHGSRNIGMTNVWRCCGAEAGLLTMVADILKSALPLWFVCGLYTPSQLASLGVAAVVGHCFSAYLTFSGGKGVATTGGVLLIMSPLMFSMVFGLWLVIRLWTGKSSPAALSAMILTLILGYWLWPADGVLLLSLLGVLIARHKDNIQRLFKGTELNA